MVHANRSDYDRAAADFGLALRLEPRFLPARFQRGVAYRLKGKNAFAILELGRYLQAKPDSARALSQRGLAYVAEGRYDEAVADFDRVIELNPKDLEAQGRRDEAARLRRRCPGADGAGGAMGQGLGRP